MQNGRHEGYISWQDAFALWGQVEQQTNTIIQLEGRAAHVKVRNGVISGSVVAYARSSPNERGEEVCRVGYSFPHSEYATFPGMLVNRLYRVLGDIERAEKAKEIAQSALPF